MSTRAGNRELTLAEYIIYRANPQRFAEEILGFHPLPQQAEVLDLKARRGILCCHRQWGKTTATAAKAIHHAVFNENSMTLILAPVLNQAGELLRAIRKFTRKLGCPVKTDSVNRISLELPNGSRVIALPCDEGKVRAFSGVGLLLVDEAARVPDDVYYSTLPMLATTDGAIWLMSTPNGRSGFFYETWTATHDSEWIKIEGSAETSNRISPAVLARHRQTMPAARFREEYLCGFQDAEEQIFASVDIDAAFDPEVRPLDARAIDIDLSKTTSIYYSIGVDLGQARDHTVIMALEVLTQLTGLTDPITRKPLERTTLRLRYLDRVPLETTYQEVAQRLREFLCHPHFQWAKSSIVIDYTGVGRSFRDVLAMSGVRNTIVPVTITGGAAQTEILGTANVPKQHLIGTLQILLQNRRIQIAPGLGHAGTLKLELENLRRNAANGYQPRNTKIHDDTVLALALAAWHATRRYRGLLPPS